MCGIVGYVGGRQAYPILVKGLTRLEYRGYDSAGVALVNDNGDLVVYKTKGKVKDLERTAEGKDVSGTVGIAHTRWATHGEPSDVNSHPHYLGVSFDEAVPLLSRNCRTSPTRLPRFWNTTHR